MTGLLLTLETMWIFKDIRLISFLHSSSNICQPDFVSHSKTLAGMESQGLFAAASWMPLHRTLIGSLHVIPVFGYHRRDPIFITADLHLFLPSFSPQDAILYPSINSIVGTAGFQFRNEQFSARSRKTRFFAETYGSTSHKETRSLTQKLRKRAIYGWKLFYFRFSTIPPLKD